VTPVYEKGEADLEAQRRCGGDRQGKYSGQSRRNYAETNCEDPSKVKARMLKSLRPRRLIGGRPTCPCLAQLADAVPCTVLDPFAGEGTTLRAALANGRFARGFELHPKWSSWALQDLTPQATSLAAMRRKKD
jgi:hypothetical protein